MKASFGFDPAACEYGDATVAVRQILSAWTAIDWLVAPPRGAGAAAAALFEEHHQKGRAHAPDLFAARIDVRPVRGGWGDFSELCARVRTPGAWDWKYSALKPLSHAHSQARGWSLQNEAPPASLGPPRGPGTGDLFWRFGDHTMWVDLSPRLDLRSALPPLPAEAAAWYLGYTGMDVLEAVEWQLAERSSHLDDNPFVPLLRCYAAGFHPFSLGPGTVVLFGFERDA